MDYRKLGKTGLELSSLSFGASSLGAEFRSVDLDDAMAAVRTAIDVGMNFIDTSPYYGRGMSEILLGIVLKNIPRNRYFIGTKLGRYDKNHFDFSARRVVESVDVSLHRLGIEYLDVCLCHDIEFVDIKLIVEETLPALKEIQRAGKVRFVGVSGYPMKIFQEVLGQVDLDVVLSYNHYTLQNTMLGDLVPYLKSKNVGIMNAAPFAARLLTDDALPAWHKASTDVRRIARQAADHCRNRGSDIAKLALQFSLANPDMTTCITGSARPDRVREWSRWADAPIDNQLLSEVAQILKPIHNWFHIEGRPENNDDIHLR